MSVKIEYQYGEDVVVIDNVYYGPLALYEFNGLRFAMSIFHETSLLAMKQVTDAKLTHMHPDHRITMRIRCQPYVFYEAAVYALSREEVRPLAEMFSKLSDHKKSIVKVEYEGIVLAEWKKGVVTWDKPYIPDEILRSIIGDCLEEKLKDSAY